MFGPSLYIGGMAGGAVGLLTQLILRHSDTHPEAFALVGMGAVFAGVVRAPVTSIIIIFEMTGNYALILPLMVANITSYAVASRLNPTPIYDALLLQDNIHLPHAEHESLSRLRVGAAMCHPVVAVPGELTVEKVISYVHLRQATGRGAGPGLVREEQSRSGQGGARPLRSERWRGREAHPSFTCG
ncbi:MAG: chloride channel protein [Acidobacteria bacterium]|nr:chloride channel protein [Acidobacteriota bacterium]